MPWKLISTLYLGFGSANALEEREDRVIIPLRAPTQFTPHLAKTTAALGKPSPRSQLSQVLVTAPALAPEPGVIHCPPSQPTLY